MNYEQKELNDESEIENTIVEKIKRTISEKQKSHIENLAKKRKGTRAKFTPIQEGVIVVPTEVQEGDGSSKIKRKKKIIKYIEEESSSEEEIIVVKKKKKLPVILEEKKQKPRPKKVIEKVAEPIKPQYSYSIF